MVIIRSYLVCCLGIVPDYSRTVTGWTVMGCPQYGGGLAGSYVFNKHFALILLTNIQKLTSGVHPEIPVAVGSWQISPHLWLTCTFYLVKYLVLNSKFLTKAVNDDQGDLP